MFPTPPMQYVYHDLTPFACCVTVPACVEMSANYSCPVGLHLWYGINHTQCAGIGAPASYPTNLHRRPPVEGVSELKRSIPISRIIYKSYGPSVLSKYALQTPPALPAE